MHDITLDQAAERAHQAEIICAMLEVYPNKLVDSEIIAIASLLKHLTGNVASWLIEEQTLREAKNNE